MTRDSWYSDAAWEVLKAYDIDTLSTGPGHSVFGDGNLEDSSIDFCLWACDDTYWAEFNELCTETRTALLALQNIPEAQRYAEGENND